MVYTINKISKVMNKNKELLEYKEKLKSLSSAPQYGVLQQSEYNEKTKEYLNNFYLSERRC